MASPESVLTRHWKETIRDVYGDKLCVVAYDEAHCISEWYVLLYDIDNSSINIEHFIYKSWSSGPYLFSPVLYLLAFLQHNYLLCAKCGLKLFLLYRGLEFREDYQKVGVLQSIFEVPVLAITATVTKEIQRDVNRVLGLHDDTKVVATLPDRYIILIFIRI